jgi:hypothetical protein
MSIRTSTNQVKGKNLGGNEGEKIYGQSIAIKGKGTKGY